MCWLKFSLLSTSAIPKVHGKLVCKVFCVAGGTKRERKILNFAILFPSVKLKEKTTIFRNCNFFCQAFFLHSGNQAFAYHAYTIYLYIK